MWPPRGTGRRVLLAASALLALLACGVGGYARLGFSLPDAVYLTVMTLTTEGFSGADRLSEAGKLFTAALAVVGVAVFVAVLGLIGTALVEGRFGPAGRKRRMQHRIDALRDHFIVCAYGRVGQAVTREFAAEGVPFVVIESDAALEERLQRERALYLIGNAASEQVLRRAGIDHARGLVCAVDSDAENVYITLIAHSLNPSLAIVSRASEAASAERLTHAGASSVVSPYITSGRRMALLAVRPHVVDFLEFTRAGSSDFRIEEIRFDAGSRLVGRPLRQACGGALPLLIRRADGALEPNPDPETAVRAGDTMIVFGDPGALRPIEDE